MINKYAWRPCIKLESARAGGGVKIGEEKSTFCHLQCNIKREGEEGSGVSHRLGFEDEETVSEGDQVENRWQKKEFPSMDARSAGAEKGMDYGIIHLRSDLLQSSGQIETGPTPQLKGEVHPKGHNLGVIRAYFRDHNGGNG